MPVPDPPWKVRTRPCPFYSQGRCLFADSCNYLHEVKIRATPVITAKELQEAGRSSSDSAREGPQQDILKENNGRLMSPPRSPRMQSLLAALGDAITPEEPDPLELPEAEEDAQDSVVSAGTTVHPMRKGDAENVVLQVPIAKEALEKEGIAPVDGNTSSHGLGLSHPIAIPGSHEENVQLPVPEVREDGDPSAEDIAYSGQEPLHPSPIQESGVESVLFSASEEDEGDQADVERDSAQDTIAPLVHSLSHPSPVQESLLAYTSDSTSSPSLASQSADHTPSLPPHDPSPSSSSPPHADHPFDMLSPVSLAGGAPPTPFPLDFCSLERADSVDSGYADSWTGPTPLVLSPPRSPGPRASTLSLLSSPFGTPARILRRVSVQGILLSPGKPTFSNGKEEDEEGDGEPTPSAHVDGDADDLDSLDSFELDEGPALDMNDKSSSFPSPQRQYSLDSPAEGSFHPSAHSSLSSGIMDAYYGYNEDPQEASESRTVKPGSVQLLARDVDAASPLLSEPLPDYAVESRESPRTVQSRPASLSTPAADGSLLSYADELSSPAAESASALGYANDLSTPAAQSATAPSCVDELSTPAASPLTSEDELASSRIGSVSLLSFPLPLQAPSSSREPSSSSPPRPLPLSQESQPTDLASSPQARVVTPSTSHSPVRVVTPPTAHSPAIQVHAVPTTNSPIPSPSSARSRSSLVLAQSNDGSQNQNHENVASVSPLPSKKVPLAFRRRPASMQIRAASFGPAGNYEATGSPSSPAIATSRSLEHSRSTSPAFSVEGSSKLRPLRLSRILSPSSFEFSEPGPSSRPLSVQSYKDSMHAPKSPSVSSEQSISDLQLLSSARSSLIPEDIRDMVARNNHASPSPSTHSHSSKPYNAPPLSAPINRPISWLKFSHTRPSSRASLYDQSPARALSRLSEPSWHQDGDEASDDEDHDRYDHRTVRKTPSPLPGAAPSRTRPVSSIFHSPPASALPTVSFSSRRASSIYLHSPVPTPKPTLMFAIASDDVDEVKRVLDSGEAGPNEQVGPQSALAFVLTNERLKNKIGIVKELLKHGADPGALRSVESNPPEVGGGEEEEEEVVMLSPPRETTLEGMDPATRYYISMADNTDTRRASALIHRSFFRPLARVRYDIIGQDRALEQLFRVLSMNSQSFSVAPLVVLLCGPSGHGKSLLARKFGSLLEVPTHTVNMTTLRSTHDIWQSHSMNPYEEPSSSTLAEFLIDNERKRCVVVLDEIDKTEDEKFLLSLLMPWELGRCSPEAGRRHIDVRKVIWIGTSNIGHDLVFAHEAERAAPYSKLSRDEYVELMKQLRPVVSDRLGPSLISRVTTVLPFVPFTEDEKMAIAAEALFTLGKDIIQSLTPETVEGLIRRALEDYLSDEGARCLYRSVSTLLLDLPM